MNTSTVLEPDQITSVCPLAGRHTEVTTVRFAKEIEMKLKCRRCNGLGLYHATYGATCLDCRGRGYIDEARCRDAIKFFTTSKATGRYAPAWCDTQIRRWVRLLHFFVNRDPEIDRLRNLLATPDVDRDALRELITEAERRIGAIAVKKAD